MKFKTVFLCLCSNFRGYIKNGRWIKSGGGSVKSLTNLEGYAGMIPVEAWWGKIMW